MIHEFDPYFNYRTTRFLAEEGFYSFHNWFDDRAWYPLGRIIGGTIYPGTDAWRVTCLHLMFTLPTMRPSFFLFQLIVLESAGSADSAGETTDFPLFRCFGC